MIDFLFFRLALEVFPVPNYHPSLLFHCTCQHIDLKGELINPCHLIDYYKYNDITSMIDYDLDSFGEGGGYARRYSEDGRGSGSRAVLLCL